MEEKENEEWDEQDFETKFERAYSKEEILASPKGTESDKAGFFDRLSGRAYKDEKKKNTELSTRVAFLEKENEDLKKQFRRENQKRQEQRQKLHSIMTDCSYIQLGDGNTIKIFEYDIDREDPIPMIKKLFDMIKSANDKMIHMLTVSENKLNQNDKYLQKIHSIVQQLQENKPASVKTQMIEELKEMVEIPTKKDDFSSIEDAFEGFKANESKKGGFEHLGSLARRGIRLIVYKFGSMTIQAFANVLGQRIEKQSIPSEETLDEKACCSIILNWLSTHENDVEKLINILKSHDNQIAMNSKQSLKQETFMKLYDLPEIRSTDDLSDTSSSLGAFQFGRSVLSLRSSTSDVSETFENIEKHVSETLQKTNDNPPDTNALLCALYSLAMENTRLLQEVSEKVGASDNYVGNPINNMKSNPKDKIEERETDEKNNTKEHDERVVKYV